MAREKKAPVLTDTQFKRVLASVKAREQAARNTALLYFSVSLGLRAKELSQLSIRDVIARDGSIKEEVLLTRSTTKGSKQRLVYLANRDVLKALKAYLEERAQTDTIALHPDSPLFKSRKGGRFSPNTMQMLFKRIYIEAGFPSASSHSGRRTFATTLIEQGVDIKAVSTLMGHATVAMTAQYVAENPVRLRRICQDIRAGVAH